MMEAEVEVAAAVFRAGPPLEFSFDFLAQKLEEFYRGREGEEVDYRGKASRRQLSQVPASVLHTFSPQSSVANTGRS
jgi:hypothetical protein